ERDLHSIALRHQDVGNDEVSRCLAIECEADLAVGGFTNLMTVFFKNVAQYRPDRCIIVDDQDTGHALSSPSQNSVSTCLCGGGVWIRCQAARMTTECTSVWSSSSSCSAALFANTNAGCTLASRHLHGVGAKVL